MGGRNALFKFIVVLLLIIIGAIQIMSIKQVHKVDRDILDIKMQLKDGVSMISSSSVNTNSGESVKDEGDWLVYHLLGEPAVLTRILTSADMSTEYIVSGNIYETLLTMDLDTMEFKPLIAESYSVSNDGLEIYYKIREDVYFSDGEQLTADDVIFTVNTIMNPEIDASDLASYFVDVEKVEKISDFEVKFYMSKAYFKAVTFTGMTGIMPEHVYKFKDPKDFNARVSDPVGSGPFVFEKWDKGEKVVLARNKNYWNKEVYPKIDKVIYRFISNSSAAFQSLKSGEIDFYRSRMEQYEDLIKNSNAEERLHCLKFWDPYNGYRYIGWNQDQKSGLFKDKRVRRALTQMLDRDSVCKDLFKNPYAKVPIGPFFINGKQNNSDIKPLPYDFKVATDLLKEAGWADTDGNGVIDKDGVQFEFKLSIPAGSDAYYDFSRYLKDSYAKAGIDVTVEPYEWSVFIQKLQTRDFDAAISGWGGGGVEADPYQIWHSQSIGNKGSNYIGFSVPEADKLMVEARGTMDLEKRTELFHKLQQIIHDEQPYTFLYTSPVPLFVDKRFKNVEVHKLGVDFHEWYVPKELQKYK